MKEKKLELKSTLPSPNLPVKKKMGGIIHADHINHECRKLGLVCRNLGDATRMINEVEQKRQKENRAAYYKQGLIFCQVQMLQLYRDKYPRFIDYVKQEFGLHFTRAYQLMAIADNLQWEEIESFADRFTAVLELSPHRIEEGKRKELIAYARKVVKKNPDIPTGALVEKIRKKKDPEKYKKDQEAKIVRSSQNAFFELKTTEEPIKLKFCRENGELLKTKMELLAAPLATTTLDLDEHYGIQLTLNLSTAQLFAEYVKKD